MSVWNRIGVVIALVLAGSQLFNGAVAWTDPIRFAARLGLPLSPAEDPRWVGIYALRAAANGLLLAGLVGARQWRALFILCVAALITPMGDAFLTYSHGAPFATVLRHCTYVVVIAFAAFCLAQTPKPGEA